MPILPKFSETFTEFYVDRVSGSNLYAGSTKEMPILISQSGTWYNSLNHFHCSGNPDLSIINIGMWASVFPQGTGLFGATTLVAMVTGIDNTTKRVYLSSRQRFANASLQFGSGNRTMIVGGPWYGPRNVPYAGASPQQSSFPFGTANSGLWRVTNQYPRVNFLNNATYEITGTITNTSVGPITWAGYESVPGDTGRIFVRGSGVGQGFVFYNATTAATDNYLHNMVFSRNGNNGVSDGVSILGISNIVNNCTVYDMRGHGFSLAANGTIAIECEAYRCNVSNTAANAGFRFAANFGVTTLRCISHNNSGLGTDGFNTATAASVAPIIIDCISDSNARHGFGLFGQDIAIMKNCDSYNNRQNGLYITPGGNGLINIIENSNFVRNSGYGIRCDVIQGFTFIRNCGFGSGIYQNTSGAMLIASGNRITKDNFVYPKDRKIWIDPDAGDFRLCAPESRSFGRGTFVQTVSGGWMNKTMGNDCVGACMPLIPMAIWDQEKGYH